ncbi:MAG TPA: translocation/assembly module TamB domain-containing protein [Armatimonadota bacterium]|jgi:hypothetical protein
MRRNLLTHRRIVLATLLLFVGLTAVYTYSRVRYITQNLDKVLAVEVANQLGRAVSARKAHISAGGRLVLDGIRCANGADFDTGLLLEARRAVVQVSLWRLLLSPNSPASAISSLTVEDPHLYLVRDKTGRWNTTSPRRRPQGAPPFRFPALIRLSGGVLDMEDYFPKQVATPVRNRFVAITGSVDGRSTEGYRLDLAGHSALPQAREVAIKGVFDPVSVTTDIGMRVGQADVGFWSRYLGLIKALQPVGGRADADLRLQAVQGHFDPDWITGSIRGTGISISSKYLTRPLDKGRVTLTFHGREIALAGAANLNGTPIAAAGTLLADAPVVLNLRVSSKAANLRKLAEVVKAVRVDPSITLPATGKVSLRVTGTAPNPAVSGTAEFGGLVASGRKVQGLALVAGYRAGVLMVRSARARAFGGTVALSGQALLQAKPYQVRAQGVVQGLRLADLPPDLVRDARGTLSGRFRVSGALNRPTGEASYTLSNAVWRRVSAASVSGTATARPDGQMLVHAAIRGAGAQGLSAASGTADLDWRRGSPLGGSLTLQDARARGLRLRDVTASGTWQGGTLRLARAKARGYGGQATANGTVGPNGALHLSVAARGLQLGPLTAALGYGKGIAGTAAFSGSLVGTAAKPAATGQLLVERGALQGRAFDRLIAQTTVSPTRVSFRNATLERGDGRLVASGDVALTRGKPTFVSATAEVSQVAAQDVIALTGREEQVPGILQGHLAASGPPSSLLLSGSLSLRDTEFAGVPLSEVRASFRREGQATEIESLVATGDGFSVTGTGELREGNYLVLNTEGEGLPLNRFASLFAPYAEVRGTASFAAAVVGPLKSPSVSGHLVARNLLVNGTPFTSLEASLGYMSGSLLLTNTSLRWGTSDLSLSQARYLPATKTLEASGTLAQADLSQPFTALLASPYLRTKTGRDLAQQLARIPRPVTGVATGSFDVGGTTTDPSLAAKLTATQVALGDVTVGDVAFNGRWRGSDGLTLESASVTNPRITLVANGQLRPDLPTRLKVEATQGTLEGLLAFVESFRFLAGEDAADRVFAAVQKLPKPLKGTINNATLVLIGGQPVVTGQVVFSLRGVQISRQTVNGLSGTLDVRGSTLLVRNLHAEGTDMDLVVTGSAETQGQLDLVVDANYVALPLLIPWLHLPEDLKGTANGHLEVKGTTEKPDVSGYLTARDVRVGPAALQSVRVLDIHVANDQLVLGSITVVTAQGYTAQASGTLPLRAKGIGIAQDQPINFTASLEKQDLAILAAVWPEIKEAKGAFDGSLSVTGTLEDPRFTGNVVLVDGSVDFNHLTSTIQNLTARLTMQGREVTIQELSGTSTSGGGFKGSGTVTFAELTKPQPQLTLQLSDLALAGDNVTQRFGEKFRTIVTGQLAMKPGDPLPVVTGDVTVTTPPSAVTLSLPPAAPAPGKFAPPLLPNLALDVKVALAPDTKVDRGSAHLRGQGDLVAGGTLREPTLQGTLDLAGYVDFYRLQRFDVQKGSTVRVYYNAKAATDPSVRSVAVMDPVRARTAIRAISPLGEWQRYWVTVVLEGPVDLTIPETTRSFYPFVTSVRTTPKYQVSFESDPPDLSDQQIVAALSRGVQFQSILQGQNMETVFRQQLADAFTGAIAPQFLEPFQTALAQALGLEDISLVFSFSSAPQVQLSKHVGGPIWLSYRRTLAGTIPEFQFKMSYRFLPRYQLSWSTDERGVHLWSLEAHQRFDSLLGPRLSGEPGDHVVQVPPRKARKRTEKS